MLGTLDVIVIASDEEVHGPLPSASGIFHVNVIVVPISPIVGVYVALAVFLFGLNVPVPPVQIPPVAVFAAKVTALVAQVVISAPAFARIELFTVINISSDEATQGPLPSGSGIFQVRVTDDPFSDMAGM
jgi:hypothetical protein